MYIPPHFNQANKQTLLALVRDHPLATLITLSTDGLNANHIPLVWMDDGSTFGCLQGHVAKANPMILDQNDVLAIFQAENAYISPSWYATKQQSGKVVPTWNYAAVHAYGKLQAITDVAWIRSHLDALTAQHEAALPLPWALSDAPHDFTEALIEHIVGIEIRLTRLQGKWKVSQNQSTENRNGVIKGLQAVGKLDMSALVAASQRTFE